MIERESTPIASGSIGRFALWTNVLPLVLLGGFAGVAWNLAEGGTARLAIFAALLYLVPPVLARLLMALWGRPEGRDLSQNTRPFRVWWLLLQLQMPFNRLPWLEELLRLAPGCYPLWLNLWGARANLSTFWGPGARMLDRPLLETGFGSVIGADALLGGHLARVEEGRFLVDIAPVRIGARAVVGARSSIGPGCVIAPGETLTACARLAPFQIYARGRRR